MAIVPVGFGVFTFGFWAFFRLRKESEAEVADQERVGLPDDELVESSPLAGE